MTIFVFTPSYPNSNNSIANIFVKEQVDVLRSLGHKVVVLTILKKPTKLFFAKIDRRVKSGNCFDKEVLYIEQKTFFESKFPRLAQKLINQSFEKVYKRAVLIYGKPDVIYSHFLAAAYTAVTIQTDVPVVALEHSGSLMTNNIKRFDKQCLVKVVEMAKKYIVTSQSLKESAIKITNTRKNIYVVPNMINDIYHYYPLPDSGFFTFFSLSRLEYDKRIDLLIDSFCDVFSETDRVNLFIGGQGKEFSNLQKLINLRGRCKQIKLLGQLTREESLDYYIKCSCFVLPSRHETFGMVWREAMCVGRPVITTNHGGFSADDFNEKYGLMVGVDDRTALSNSLKLIVERFQNYNLKTISSENLSRYSSKVIARTIETMLLEANSNEN